LLEDEGYSDIEIPEMGQEYIYSKRKDCSNLKNLVSLFF